MFRSNLLFALVAVASFGCRCGPPVTTTLRPDFDPDPKGLSFEACPVKDEAGAPVKDVYPDEKKFTLHNKGKASGSVVLSLSGPQKSDFSVVNPPSSLDPTASEELTVRFTPTAKGAAEATLTIEDGSDATDPVFVSLTGRGRNLPSQPTLEVALESKDQAGLFTACFAGGLCQQLYADTFYGESSTLEVKLKNLGCPALKITAAEVLPWPGSPSTNLGFFLDEPGVPPSATAPIELTTSDGRAETVFKVRFAPSNDGTGITQRYALLSLKTNDPANATFDIVLFGNAAEPAIYAQPTFCDFSLAADLCGYPTKQPNKARFEIKNGGNTPVTISSVKLGRPTLGRFTITKNVQGVTIPAGSSDTLEVSHTDQPVYVTDLLTVTGTAGSQSAGSAILTLAGGNKPCLATEPADQLDFQDPVDELTKKQVTIKNELTKNGAPCGDLVVNRVVVDSNPFFSVVEPLVPAGTTVRAGNAVVATVQYKKPVSGGTQTGVLRLDTNDPDFGPPPFKVVRLYSQSPLDQLPVAVLKGCLPTDTTCAAGQTTSMAVKLSTLNPKELILSGKDSYDPGNSSPTPISAYQFRLVGSNTTGVTLEKDGQKVPQSSVKLTFGVNANGVYRVVLLVFDDKNQQSGIPSELKINVTQ